MGAGSIKFGAFELDGGQRQLRRDGREIHLTPKAFDLLGLLIEHAPQVVPKAELHRAMWPTSVVSDATLVGLIKELRRALDDRNVDVHNTRIADVMTRSPKTIGSDALAVEAAQLMEAHKIGGLLVVDTERRVVGALNIHDLLRARVV